MGLSNMSDNDGWEKFNPTKKKGYDFKSEEWDLCWINGPAMCVCRTLPDGRVEHVKTAKDGVYRKIEAKN